MSVQCLKCLCSSARASHILGHSELTVNKIQIFDHDSKKGLFFIVCCAGHRKKGCRDCEATLGCSEVSTFSINTLRRDLNGEEEKTFNIEFGKSFIWA